MTRACAKFASEHQTPPTEMVGGPWGRQPPGAGSSAVAQVVTVAELGRLRRRQARRAGEAALTYRELAGKTGWSRGIIGEYFAGHVLPPTDRFDELIRLLGATAAEQGALATARDRVEEHRRGRPSTNNSLYLPAAVTGLVGRDNESRAVVDLLASSSSRPVTLTRSVGRALLLWWGWHMPSPPVLPRSDRDCQLSEGSRAPIPGSTSVASS